jgi:hypothetical protein
MTPMHGSMTPMHGSATPMHGSMTPMHGSATPMHDYIGTPGGMTFDAWNAAVPNTPRVDHDFDEELPYTPGTVGEGFTPMPSSSTPNRNQRSGYTPVPSTPGSDVSYGEAIFLPYPIHYYTENF